MSIGLRAPSETMMRGAADGGLRQWRSLCRRMAREHRRALSQFSEREFREYIEWVAEQWDLASKSTGLDILLRFQRLVQQVTSHREMMVRLRSTRQRRAQPRNVVRLPGGWE